MIWRTRSQQESMMWFDGSLDFISFACDVEFRKPHTDIIHADKCSRMKT